MYSRGESRIPFPRYTALQSFLFVVSILSHGQLSAGVDYDIHLKMPASKPSVDEEYMCHGMKVQQPGFIKEFVPVAQVSRVHHLIVFGCSSDFEPPGPVWGCQDIVCEGVVPSILYAWARNAPPLQLPDSVAVAIGGNSSVDYLVLQMHYNLQFIGDVLDYSGVTMKATSDMPVFFAGVFLLAAGTDQPIPPGRNEFPTNMSCEYDGDGELHPFAFRTHAHALGRIVTGYRVRQDDYHLIGKGNPQWPQLFYPVKEDVPIKSGDFVAAQCIFNSTSRDAVTEIGHHGLDEMCNFYMYFYVAAKHADVISSFSQCLTPPIAGLFDKYPKEARVPLPRNEHFESEAAVISDRFGVTSDLEWMGAELKKFGQISGLAMDAEGNLVVFHRGDRVWDAETFDESNRFRSANDGPLSSNVLAVIGPGGKMISQWGAGLFYLPHGVFVDQKNKLWLTDVAMHQVFRYDWKAQRPELELGQKLTPGSDKNSFCKPAAVAVTSKGAVYVADGYCNNRVVQFSYDGQFVKAFQLTKENDPIPLSIVHDISIDETSDALFVADRTNGRVVSFKLDGSFNGIISDPFLTGAVYGVRFCKHGNVLFVLTGPSPTLDAKTESRVYVFDASSRMLLYSFRPERMNFDETHSITCSKACDTIYVSMLKTSVVVKMVISAMGPPVPHITFPPESSQQQVVAVSQSSKPVSSYSGILVGGFGTFAIIAIVLIAMIGCRFVSRRRKDDDHSRHPLLKNSKWKKGFQPLNTEDIQGVDCASDDSEEREDLLYTPKMTSGSNL